jgi:RNA polymerase sigma-70 factor (ECF subfamily)
VPEDSDIDLVKRAQGGEVSAIGELYDRHHMRIFRYVCSLVHNQHLAQDLTGEVFERMLAALPRYRLRGVSFQAWLYRIAHNLAMDHHRRANRYGMVPLEHIVDADHGEGNPTAIVEQRLTAERVQCALKGLDPVQREVVVLRFLVGLSLQETAQALRKTVPAVKSLQHRGLVTLRSALKEG